MMVLLLLFKEKTKTKYVYVFIRTHNYLTKFDFLNTNFFTKSNFPKVVGGISDDFGGNELKLANINEMLVGTEM